MFYVRTHFFLKLLIFQLFQIFYTGQFFVTGMHSFYLRAWVPSIMRFHCTARERSLASLEQWCLCKNVKPATMEYNRNPTRYMFIQGMIFVKFYYKLFYWEKCCRMSQYPIRIFSLSSTKSDLAIFVKTKCMLYIGYNYTPTIFNADDKKSRKKGALISNKNGASAVKRLL